MANSTANDIAISIIFFEIIVMFTSQLDEGVANL